MVVQLRISIDGTFIAKDGSVEVKMFSPLATSAGKKVVDLEDLSLRPDENETIFVLSDRAPGFDQLLRYHRAMRTVVGSWKGDPHRSEEAHRLASERESNHLQKLRGELITGIQNGLVAAMVNSFQSERGLSIHSLR